MSRSKIKLQAGGKMTQRPIKIWDDGSVSLYSHDDGKSSTRKRKDMLAKDIAAYLGMTGRGDGIAVTNSSVIALFWHTANFDFLLKMLFLKTSGAMPDIQELLVKQAHVMKGDEEFDIGEDMDDAEGKYPIKRGNQVIKGTKTTNTKGEPNVNLALAILSHWVKGLKNRKDDTISREYLLERWNTTFQDASLYRGKEKDFEAWKASMDNAPEILPSVDVWPKGLEPEELNGHGECDLELYNRGWWLFTFFSQHMVKWRIERHVWKTDDKGNAKKDEVNLAETTKAPTWWTKAPDVKAIVARIRPEKEPVEEEYTREEYDAITCDYIVKDFETMEGSMTWSEHIVTHNLSGFSTKIPPTREGKLRNPCLFEGMALEAWRNTIRDQFMCKKRHMKLFDIEMEGQDVDGNTLSAAYIWSDEEGETVHLEQVKDAFTEPGVVKVVFHLAFQLGGQEIQEKCGFDDGFLMMRRGKVIRIARCDAAVPEYVDSGIERPRLPSPTVEEGVDEPESMGDINLQPNNSETLLQSSHEAAEGLLAKALRRNRELQAQAHDVDMQKMIEEVFREMNRADQSA